MKIVFMGTPDFAANALERIIQAGHEVTLVVTQPDKAKGRSDKLIFSPVKEVAVRYNLPVFQPTRIKKEEAVNELRKYEADVFVVAAFGQILSKEILDMPKLGCINIHASLLPKYRGSSPIQHAILNGETQTGVTIMQMDEGVDTGDMLYMKETDIDAKETFESLHDKLMVLGGEAICEFLPMLEAGNINPVKQSEAMCSHAPMISKQMGELDFADDCIALDRHIRAFNPWPGSYSFLNGKQLKIWNADVVSDSKYDGFGAGTVCGIDKNTVFVKCGKGALAVKELQLEGKKRMSAHDFLLGVKLNEGDRLGF